LLTASLLALIRQRPSSSWWRRIRRSAMGNRIYGRSHFVIFEQRTHLLVDCVLVRYPRQATHIQPTIFFRRSLEVLCCVLSLPSIEDVWVAFIFLKASCWSGLRAPALVVRQCLWSSTFRSILSPLRRVDVDFDRTAHDLLSIQLFHCAISFISGTQLDKAIRWIPASERVC
jgi:hypothetical protein